MRGEGETQSGGPLAFRALPIGQPPPPRHAPDFGLAHRGRDPAHEEREGPLTPGRPGVGEESGARGARGGGRVATGVRWARLSLFHGGD